MGSGASKRRAEEARQKSWQTYGLATLQGHTSDVQAVASYTTQAGAVRVVSGSSDGIVNVWRTSDEARTLSQKVAPAAYSQAPTQQQTMTITVPPGAGPGTTLRVMTPSRQPMDIVVPPGAGPGTQLQVPVPVR